VAREAAHRAARILRERLQSDLDIRKKGRADLVTAADYAAERAILDCILAAFPAHAFLSEEEGASRESSTHRWIIDPLDGTMNYAHGYPAFCTSIALEIEGQLAVGVIGDPMMSETFWAVRGGGAYLNGAPIRVSEQATLEDSLLATGFSYDRAAMHRNLDFFSRFMHQAAGVRRDGSAARNFAHLACGRFDGVWEVKLKPWDLAAGFLLITEAGGRITGFQGQPVTIYDRDIILSNGRIHEAMRALLVAPPAADLVHTK
jgi:myo-inositol-1(or 4)-monophosphatase